MVIHSSSSFFDAKKHDIRQWPSKLIFLPRVFSMGPRLFRRVFSTRRWPPDVQGPFGDQSRRKNSTRTCQMTRSSSFVVQIGSKGSPDTRRPKVAKTQKENKKKTTTKKRNANEPQEARSSTSWESSLFDSDRVSRFSDTSFFDGAPFV